MIEKYTQEEFIGSDIFERCEEIYLEKFFMEESYDLDDYSGLTYFTMIENDGLIGFGSYQDNDYLFIVETIFDDEFVYSDFHKQLVNHIVDQIKSLKRDKFFICSYQPSVEDSKFYQDLGFKIERDFGSFFPVGKDMTRFVLRLN